MRLWTAVVCLVALGGAARAANVEIRMATLAPKGSAWARVLDKGARDIEKKTEGRVTIKYFYAASQGSEREVVRKMRVGALEGAAVSGLGLGLIGGDVRVLEMPFLFRNDAEIDHVRQALRGTFEKQLGDAGYVLLAWGDVGWIHVLSVEPFRTREDFGKHKIWAWADDEIVRTMLKRLGVVPVPLDVPDVADALDKGVIDACYNSLLAAIAFGWHAKIKYASAEPIAYGVGALLVRNETWARIGPADQKTVKAVMAEMEGQLKREAHDVHIKAKKAMMKNGIKFVTTPPVLLAELRKESEGVTQDLTGKLFSAETLAEVRKRIAEVRK